MNIEFNYSEERFNFLDEKKIIEWIEKVIENEKKKIGTICYNFVTEEEILEINKSHLHHDYYTDIITFDTSFVNIINGDIIISIDTIKTNAKIINAPLDTEIHRVIIHGIMHLCGFKDYTQEEKTKMRAVENKYLSYLEKL